MPRGGKRQGTPGKGFANRTDLATNRMPAMDANSAATGGLPSPSPGPSAPPQQMMARSPEDSPMLTDPSNRPGEPVTAGSDFGPGPGSEALDMPTYAGQRETDVQTLKSMLPELQAATKFDGAPETFKSLVNYLKRL